jgi:diacylglycerol kinase family enzyme
VRLTLVVNAAASSVTARTRVVIQRRLAAAHHLEVVETGRRGHATRLAHGAARAGAEVVVAFGGDGTLNEVANGLVGTEAALATLPGGSTNVFARSLGLPNDPVLAVDQLLAALDEGRIERVGLGSANGRYFLFHVGAGFDAAVVDQVERRGLLKRYAGHPLFMAAAAQTWARHVDRDRPWFRIVTEGEAVDDAWFAIALNTRPYTYLGNRAIDVAPEAGLDRPLSVVALRSMGLLVLLGAARAALGNGRGLAHGGPAVHWADVSWCRFEGHRPFPYQLDGDHLGTVDELRIIHHPRVLRLVRPRAAGEGAERAGARVADPGPAGPGPGRR